MVTQLIPIPSTVAPHVTRIYQSLARPYISLAEAFEKGDLQKLSAEIGIGQSIWRGVREYSISFIALLMLMTTGQQFRACIPSLGGIR